MNWDDREADYWYGKENMIVIVLQCFYVAYINTQKDHLFNISIYDYDIEDLWKHKDDLYPVPAGQL